MFHSYFTCYLFDDYNCYYHTGVCDCCCCCCCSCSYQNIFLIFSCFLLDLKRFRVRVQVSINNFDIKRKIITVIAVSNTLFLFINLFLYFPFLSFYFLSFFFVFLLNLYFKALHRERFGGNVFNEPSEKVLTTQLAAIIAIAHYVGRNKRYNVITKQNRQYIGNMLAIHLAVCQRYKYI